MTIQKIKIGTEEHELVAEKLNSSAGSATQPVYFSDGKPVATTYALNKTVPSDAKFTDTTYSVATTSANGLMSSTDKTKLNGIASGAEVNQNAFANVKVGDTTIAADAKSDTLTLIAGSNVTLTPNASGDSVTIAATDTNTVYTHPTTSGNKHIPAGGSSGQILRWSADGTAAWGADNNTTYTLPTASSSTLGGVKTTSTVTSNSGYTACPIISGVPYYKDTNTTYTLSSLGAAAADHTHNYLPLSGGTMTGELIVNGGDSAGGSKLVLATGSGQITNSGTQTLFGFLSAAKLAVGHNSYEIMLRGSAARPTYNGSNIALQSDVPSASHTHNAGCKLRKTINADVTAGASWDIDDGYESHSTHLGIEITTSDGNYQGVWWFPQQNGTFEVNLSYCASGLRAARIRFAYSYDSHTLSVTSVEARTATGEWNHTFKITAVYDLMTTAV